MGEQVIAALLYLESFELVRFVGAGGASGALYGVVFIALNGYWKVNYRLTACLAFTASFVVGFTLYRYWTFHGAALGDIWLQLCGYALKRLGFFSANYWLLQHVVETYKKHPILVQIGIGLVGVAPSYFIVKWIFSP